MALAPGQIMLSWPATEFYAAESAADPSGGAWHQLTNIFPTTVNDEDTVSIQMDNPSRNFFRLRKP